jgi:capsular polysaccharide transport system permease protein
MTANAPAISYKPSWTGRGLDWLGARSVTAMFFATVIAPTAAATLYYGVLASNIYVSEAHFVVRGVNGQNIGGLAALFRTLGIARSVDDTFAVQNYMRSRDAMRQLNAKLNLRKMFTQSDIDFVARFEGLWAQPEFESLYTYFQNRVEVLHNDVTGITTLRVTAFTPGDSHKIASNLLELSENFVNDINKRARDDALNAAEEVRVKAEAKVIEAAAKLTAFRNKENFIDPLKSSTRGIDLIGKLSGELAETKVRRNELMETSPSNPSLPGLNSRIAVLENQIADEKLKIVGGDQSLSSKISTFERLVLEREFTDRAFSSALESVESARQEARQKKLYIEKIVKPNLPDKSTEPKRLLNIVATLFFGLMLYFMSWLVLSGAREHSHAS